MSESGLTEQEKADLAQLLDPGNTNQDLRHTDNKQEKHCGPKFS